MSARRATVTPIRRLQQTDDGLQQLRSLIRPDFLEETGWNPEKQFLAPPREHPLLGTRTCLVVDCLASVRGPQVDLCISCERRHNGQGKPPIEEFASIATGKSNKGERICVAPACERPNNSREGLCLAHRVHRRKRREMPFETWLATDPYAAVPHLSFGDCLASSCIRVAASNHGFCVPHQRRWAQHRRGDPNAIKSQWAATTDPVTMDYIVVLKGLPERIQLEFLLALQARTDAGVRTPLTALRAILAVMRKLQISSIRELHGVPIERSRHSVPATINAFCRDLVRLTSTPESERAKDIWDLAVFGLSGNLDFTVISQGWLRAAAKHWAAEDLPTRRGRQAGHGTRDTIVSLSRLSEVLRLSREDDGEQPLILGRKDIVTFLNRFAYLEHTGKVTSSQRLRSVRRIRRFLNDVRNYGLTQPGRELEGLPADFTLKQADVPRESRIEHADRALPASVLRTLTDNLHLLEERSGISERRVVETLMDTGRRPDEVCRLPWDCLERDVNSKPVLVYTDFKNNRLGRRLPIAESTATVILTQKKLTRMQFPDTPVGELALFPRDTRNPGGTKPMAAETLTGAHRKWVDSFAEQLILEDGHLFDPMRVFPYAYRHSYAQRHADQGVTPDVLRDLMGHKSMQTTLSYYHVTEKRVRGAVDRVAHHQFDGHGQRIFHGVTALLTDEHARLRVGQVAVPFGICTEPSNVKAGGQACPYKFTCLGCGHFRSDASYLPELKSYLQQLLADRERLRAAKDIDDWARDHLMPPDEEVDQLRQLIRRVEQDLDDLTETEREAIADAISVIRKTRQTVSLGMPKIRFSVAEAK